MATRPLSGAAREWLRSAARGNPWTLERPSRAIEIAPLVSPLRLDILVRASYFEFYAEHRDLFRSDFEGYADRAREHDYFAWFQHIMCVAWQPHVLADPPALAAAWAQRLRSAAALFDSFERHGFDTRFPVTVHAARRVLPAHSDKRLARALFAGDGNHRLALLLMRGQATLQPDQCRIKRFLRLSPSDTTAPLLAVLRPELDRYVAFLRLGYPSVRIDRTGDGVAVNSPDDPILAAEVRRLVDIDLRHLTMESGRP